MIKNRMKDLKEMPLDEYQQWLDKLITDEYVKGFFDFIEREKNSSSS